MTPTPALTPHSIRPARRAELPQLPEIEREATQRFHELPGFANMPDDLTPMSELEEAFESDMVWVAEVGGEIAGYAYAVPLDGRLHLEEISVAQRFGRRGIGRSLVLEVIKRAAREGFAGVSLTTFREVVWNAPFYAGLGFRVLADSEIGPGLRHAIEDEARRGFPSTLRVAMVHEVQQDVRLPGRGDGTAVTE